MKPKPNRDKPVPVRMSSEVAREIRQHARASDKTEVCGVLIGMESEGVTTIEACIEGVNAAQGGAHVTFTQDTWEHIYKIKDRDFPDERIVGWYHSHPGFGVFLSDHDTFIHKNFFSSPQQIAWVYDPHSDEEGCFGWRGERLERLANFSFVDGRGGEAAGGDDKPRSETRLTEETERPRKSERSEHSAGEDTDLTRLTNIVSTVFSHLLIFFLGAVLVWYFLPRYVGIPVDPRTGRPLMDLPEAGFGGSLRPNPSDGGDVKPPPSGTGASKSGDAKSTDAKSGDKTRNDGHQ